MTYHPVICNIAWKRSHERLICAIDFGSKVVTNLFLSLLNVTILLAVAISSCWDAALLAELAVKTLAVCTSSAGLIGKLRRLAILSSAQARMNSGQAWICFSMSVPACCLQVVRWLIPTVYCWNNSRCKKVVPSSYYITDDEMIEMMVTKTINTTQKLMEYKLDPWIFCAAICILTPD